MNTRIVSLLFVLFFSFIRVFGDNVENGHEFVDLGLPSGTLWAKCNVGALSPEDSGLRFAWGEIETKSKFSWGNYKWCSSSTNFTKYTTKTSWTNGKNVDYLRELLPEDDAVHVLWGGLWKVPTKDDCQELIDCCVWTQEYVNEKYCFKVTGKNGNYIYIPMCGYYNDWLYFNGSEMHYMTSTLHEDNNDGFYQLYNPLSRNEVSVTVGGTRFTGYTVRGVIKTETSCPKFGAGGGYPCVNTLLIDSLSQPPLVCVEMCNVDMTNVAKKGLVVSDNESDVLLRIPEEEWDGVYSNVYNRSGYCVKDCSEIGGNIFSERLLGLMPDTKYYIRSFFKTTSGLVIYGNMVSLTTKSFVRGSWRHDENNVWGFGSLFDLVSDELITEEDGGYYYSSNENKSCRYHSGLNNNISYKFKTRWNYGLWLHGGDYPVSEPVISKENGLVKITADEGSVIYYSIDGDGLRPENFTNKYEKPIEVPGGATLYCVAVNENVEDCHSWVAAYKNMDFVTIKDGVKIVNESIRKNLQIDYCRNFSNTNWQAIYVPISMSYDDWKEDFEVAKINDINMYDIDADGEIDVTELEIIMVKNGTLKPNHPYLIKAKTTGEKIIHLQNATLYPMVDNSLDVSSAEMKFTFVGTSEGVTGEEMVANHYYAMAGGTLAYTEDTNISLKPYRWYMKAESRGGQVILPNANNSRIRVKVYGEDGEVTGIEEFVADEIIAESNVVYSLDGRIVSKNGTSGLSSGIYISNGKKIIIK